MIKEYHQRDHLSRKGRLLYTSRKPDRLGEERGREVWTLTRHSDGRRSLMSHGEIDDRPSVLRFVHLTVDSGWSPVDAFVRITVGDEFRGSGWFRFAHGVAECETVTTTDGRLSQRVPYSGICPVFGGHAIQNDGWVCAAVDLSRPGEPQTFEHFLSSTDHRGATGPTIATARPTVIYQGDEDITVGAGSFTAHHFQFVAVEGLPEEHPIYNVWTTNDGDYVFLKGQVDGYMQTYYELVELSEGL